MRFFPYLGFCLLLTSSLVAGCGDDGSGTAGAGGTGATGGTGGAGGMGGMGGTEPPPMCFEDDNCDFGEV